MKRKNKGFTLIELLAVIVILGLLMAIAIPSVTKYITESRKKTLVSSIDRYISAVLVDVNDQKYSFTDSNAIFAIPISCISLEKGGNSPFGKWSPTNEDYWAYVLVQYDDVNSSYTYGFTFKDSAGYGMKPTSINNIEEEGSQIKTDLQLDKLVSGFIKDKNNWNGFKINDDTLLVLIEDNTCNTFIPCTSTGNNIGDVVTCGSEQFYIIESNSDSVTMLAKERLDFASYMQNPSGGAIVFSLYWADGNNLKPEYGSKFPAYVYNSKSNLYKYIEGYEQNLKDFGLATADAKLISSDQLINNLKCTNNNCNNSPYVDWLKKSYNWWTGTATSRNCLWHVGKNGVLSGNSDCQGSRSIRPIVTIYRKEYFIK